MTVEKQKIAPALLQGGGFVVECGPAVALLVAAPAVLALGGLLILWPAPAFSWARSGALGVWIGAALCPIRAHSLRGAGPAPSPGREDQRTGSGPGCWWPAPAWSGSGVPAGLRQLPGRGSARKYRTKCRLKA